MKVYEFPAKIGPQSSRELPEGLVRSLATEEVVRVVVLANEATETHEDTDWSRFATGQLPAQYDDADGIYDTV